MISEIRNVEVFNQKKTVFIRENSLDNDSFKNILEMTDALLYHDTEHKTRVQTSFSHASDNEIYYLDIKVKNLSEESFDIVKKIVDIHTDNYYVMKILS